MWRATHGRAGIVLRFGNCALRLLPNATPWMSGNLVRWPVMQ